MTKLIATFLAVLVGCVCFGSIVGCSRLVSRSGGQPGPTPSEQVSNNQTAQPSAAHTTSSEGPEKQTSGNAITAEVVDEVHTPARGSGERQLMMDALREGFDNRRSDYYHPHRGSITFVVSQLKAHNGWAWVNASPQSTDSSDQFGEYNGFLLHGGDAGWAVMKLPAVINDPDDPENLDYPTRKDVQRIRQMYPSVPTDIFPGKQ
jgi:hypothetical protein